MVRHDTVAGSAARRWLAGWIVAIAAPSLAVQDVAVASTPLNAYRVVGDAIPDPLTAIPGDAARGSAIVASRQSGLCLLCHTGPFPEQVLQGNLAPDLRGAGSRWTVPQLRLRIVDSRRLHSDSIMPAYYRIDGLTQVGRPWQGKPVLTAQQVEDVVAFLATLRE